MILIVVLMLAATAGLIGQIGDSKEPLRSDTPVRIPARIAYTTHSPISITGNEGFTNESGVVWGSGTPSDPYIIEGWDINASAANGIEIWNADAHFIVRTCYLYDGRSDYHSGIELVGCANATLDSNTCWNNSNGIYLHSSGSCRLINNTCSSNYDNGIILYLSSGNTVIDNTCLDNWDSIHLYSSSNNSLSDNLFGSNHDHSLYLDDSNDNTLSNNTCLNNGESGVLLSSSNGNNITGNLIRDSRTYGIFINSGSYNKVWNNTCSNNSDGMYLRYSNNNTLVNNTCSNNGCGIYLEESTDNTLSNNNCSNNVYYGIELVSSSNNTICNNTCCSNNEWGIGLGSSSNSTISGNQLCSNLGYGVYIYSGSDNMIWNNTFIDNNGAGSTYDPSYLQAYDGGANNWWNSTDGYGNYWSDWTTPDANSDGIVDLPYAIDGSAGAMDYYPLTTTPSEPIPEFGMMPLVVMVFLVAVFLMAGARRRKSLLS